MRCHILSQRCKVYLVHEAEVQDPAGEFALGQQPVFIQGGFGLLQVLPLQRPHMMSAMHPLHSKRDGHTCRADSHV